MKKLILYSLLLIGLNTQAQTTPTPKLRSDDTFTQVDNYMIALKRLGIPSGATETLAATTTVPNSIKLFFNTTTNKLMVYRPATTDWVPAINADLTNYYTKSEVDALLAALPTPTLQSVTTVGATTTNPISITTLTAGTSTQNALTLQNTSVTAGQNVSPSLKLFGNFGSATSGWQMYTAPGPGNVSTMNFQYYNGSTYATRLNLSQAGTFGLVNTSGFTASINPSFLTASQTFNTPNASGTFALTSNLTNLLPYTGGTNSLILSGHEITADTVNAKHFIGQFYGGGFFQPSFISTGQLAAVAGSAPQTNILLRQEYNFTGTNNSPIIGIKYDPLLTSIHGANLAFWSTSGDLKMEGTGKITNAGLAGIGERPLVANSTGDIIIASSIPILDAGEGFSPSITNIASPTITFTTLSGHWMRINQQVTLDMDFVQNETTWSPGASYWFNMSLPAMESSNFNDVAQASGIFTIKNENNYIIHGQTVEANTGSQEVTISGNYGTDEAIGNTITFHLHLMYTVR